MKALHHRNLKLATLTLDNKYAACSRFFFYSNRFKIKNSRQNKNTQGKKNNKQYFKCSKSD